MNRRQQTRIAERDRRMALRILKQVIRTISYKRVRVYTCSMDILNDTVDICWSGRREWVDTGRRKVLIELHYSERLPRRRK